MAYKRKYATVEERRAAQAEGGRMGYAAALANGNHRGGRHHKQLDADPNGTTTISCRRIDARWMNEVSRKLDIPRSQLLRVLICTFRDRVDIRASDEVDEILDNESRTLFGQNALFEEDTEEE